MSQKPHNSVAKKIITAKVHYNTKYCNVLIKEAAKTVPNTATKKPLI